MRHSLLQACAIGAEPSNSVMTGPLDRDFWGGPGTVGLRICGPNYLQVSAGNFQLGRRLLYELSLCWHLVSGGQGHRAEVNPSGGLYGSSEAGVESACILPRHCGRFAYVHKHSPTECLTCIGAGLTESSQLIGTCVSRLLAK